MAVNEMSKPEPRKLDSAMSLIGKVSKDHGLISPTSEREERTSFASFKEDRNAVAQSFIDSKVSSYARYSEEAVEDSDVEIGTPSMKASHRHQSTQKSGNAPKHLMAPLTNPSTQLHSFICPCDGFRGWKQISVRGKLASKSFSDLSVFSRGFSWDPSPDIRAKSKISIQNPAGKAPIERLPNELLGAIIDQLVLDIPPNGFQPRNVDLMSLLLTSRTMHSVTLATLYNQVTIPHSSVFRKFLRHISEHPALGTIVRRLDFSHFNPTGAGMTARERAQTQNLTAATLLQSLDLLPNLREFLAQEHIDEELSTDVIRKLFELPRLRALDFCGASSTPFRDAMMGVIRSPRAMDLPQVMSITRLSFHECTILPSLVFESLLPRLPKLTHLDVTHTRITDQALASIPHTARITHLNLSKCPTLSGDKVVDFLSHHPAVKDTLVYLNLLMDAKSAEMLCAADITALLPKLPSTLRSLNLKGSKMSQNHLPLLLPLTKHLEELGIGRNLSYEDITTLIRPPPEDQKQKSLWTPHNLRYIDISDLEASQIDLGLLLGSTHSVLKASSLPLEVIEVSQAVFDRVVKQRDYLFKQAGWTIKDAGRRGWLVRDMSKLGGKFDDGGRSWKMGATYWGMRKAPVARAEVGGMYGLYMFKR